MSTRRSVALGLAGLAGAAAVGIELGRAWSDRPLESNTPSPVSLRRINRVPVKSIRPVGASALSFAWSPDGRRLAASFDWGYEVVVFDTFNWTEVSRFSGNAFQPERTLSFISNSEIVSDPSDNATDGKWALEVYNAETGQLVRQIAKPRGFEIGLVGKIAVTTSKEYVAVVGGRYRESPLLFETTSGKFIGRLSTPAHSATTVLTAGPENRLAASADILLQESRSEVRKKIYLIDASTNAIEKTLAGHVPRIDSLAWSPNGLLIASGQAMFEANGDRNWIRDPDPLRIWSATSGELVASFVGKFDPVRLMTWHPSSTVLATRSSRGDDRPGSAIRLWSARDKKMIFEWFSSAWSEINALSFHPSTGHLVWGSPGALEVFEILGTA